MRSTTRPSGSTTRLQICGFISVPPLAIAAATSAICSGVTASRSWPIATRARSTGSSGPSSCRFGDRCRSRRPGPTGRSIGGVELKPKRSMYSKRVSSPTFFAELGEPGVDRDGQRRIEGDRAPVRVEIVLQRLAFHREGAGGVDRRFRRDGSAVEAGGGGHHLERRAGRVLALGRAVEQRRSRWSAGRTERGWGRRGGSRRAPAPRPCSVRSRPRRQARLPGAPASATR